MASGKTGFKRLLVVSDPHCGHIVGLTPPQWQIKKERAKEGNIPGDIFKIQNRLWRDYRDAIDRLRPIHFCVCNGDAIDGKGNRSGGTELLTADREEQSRMAIRALTYVKPKEGYWMTYGCLTPGHRILTADLRWIPVEELSQGDEIIGFDEHSHGHCRRRFVRGKVMANVPIKLPVYCIQLSDGTSLTASEDHPFLIRRGQGYDWFTVKQLYSWMYYDQGGNTHRAAQNGQRNKRAAIPFSRTFPVWETLNSYEAGYLAGFFDGEGSCNQAKKEMRNGWPEHIFALHAYQNENAALQQTLDYLKMLGFPHNCHFRGTERANKHIALLGGRAEKLRFLGSIRPVRLLDKFKAELLGAIKTPIDNSLQIVSIDPLGEREVCGLSTDCGTYISEGFLSHNTPYHSGLEEDWENYVARELGAKIGSHEWLEIYGVVFDFKHKVSSSNIPHGRGTAIAKEKLWNQMWALRDEQPDADVIIRSHVHNAFMVGEPGLWLALTTPALQAAGTKYGGRQRSNTVDLGIIVFDVYPDGSYTWELIRFARAVRRVRATKLT